MQKLNTIEYNNTHPKEDKYNRINERGINEFWLGKKRIFNY